MTETPPYFVQAQSHSTTAFPRPPQEQRPSNSARQATAYPAAFNSPAADSIHPTALKYAEPSSHQPVKNGGTGTPRLARPGVQVKLLAQEGELYVLAQSRDRVAKERAMRRRQLRRLWTRLKQLSTMALSREELLMKLGAARDQSRTAWRLVTIEIAADSATFSYRLDRAKLRQIRSREGRYLLRTNLVEEDPAKLWSHYLLLVAVEEAFKNLKGDLAIRPVFHQREARIEAHVFIAFLAYCLHVTLSRRLHALAPGLTPRAVLEKFAAVQMIDLHLPTTDGRELVLTRYTEPEPELSLLLKKLKLELPAQPPPRITAGPVPPIPL
jgi:hypothetical protein